VELRLIIGYSLMLLLALLTAIFVGYRIYHSRERSYVRRKRRERKLYARTSFDKDTPSR